MATFVSLLRFTGEAVQNVKEGPQQLDALKQGLGAMGVQVKQFYMLMGEHDALAILEAPDDETALKSAFAMAAAGGIRTETLRAFTEDEFRSIVAGMP